MPISEFHTYEEYEKLKDDIRAKICVENVEDILQNSKNELFIRLVNLNIEDIKEIEEFYLIAFKITTALSLIWAKDTAHIQRIPVEIALEKFSTDEMLACMKKAFEKEIGQSYLVKIMEIDKLHLPAKESWAPIHARFEALARILMQNEKIFNLTTIVNNKIAFLEKKEREFNNEDEYDCSDSVKNLIDGIKQSTFQYLADNNGKIFQENLKKVFSAAYLVLEPKGWRKILDKIAQAIITAVTRQETHFSFFNNSIKDNMNKLKNDIKKNVEENDSNEPGTSDLDEPVDNPETGGVDESNLNSLDKHL
ncbi:hypothetical protein [Legionella cardiaca]|uniref:Substrate of the Dot/Icm secretion system n=1 Tax=Legionella cardiaca TaxID=1071983 RepID=A0ABY8AV14_9GAMM|nr:hypothetical protein [Legionella cardiaca]WED44423.1 hypothetical protein PXX05_06470 [Legionella cardiaca]